MNSLKTIFFACCCVCMIFAQGTASAKAKNSVASDKALQQAYHLLISNKETKVASKKQQLANAHKVKARDKAKKVAVIAAKRQINKKYRWGGTSPRTGFDCSGLMQYAYKFANIKLPRTAAAQYKFTKRVSMAKLKIGDLIFFHTRRTRARVNHVGIYLGGGKFIHAPRKGKRVSIANLSRYWRRKAVGAGRV